MCTVILEFYTLSNIFARRTFALLSKGNHKNDFNYLFNMTCYFFPFNLTLFCFIPFED